MNLMIMHDRPVPAHRQPGSNATCHARVDAALRIISIDRGIATRTHARTASAKTRHCFAQWSEADARHEDLAPYTAKALEELRAAAARLD